VTGGAFSLAGTVSAGITLTVAGGTLAGTGTLASGSKVIWNSGEIAGSLTNAGTLTAAGTGSESIGGTLTNTGTIDVTGTQTIYLASGSGATIDNEAGATFDFQADATLSTLYYVYGGISIASATFNNSGTLEMTAASGTATVDYALNNAGTVEAQSGGLALTSSVAQISASELTGGTWNVLSGSTLSIASSGSITTNDADVSLSGEGSTFPTINGIATNNGSLSIVGGANFTAAGDLSNQGNLTIGAGSTLSVKGNYMQQPSASLIVQIGGTSASNEFGRLTVRGSATLGGSVDTSLIPGFDPATGNDYTVATFATQTGGDNISFTGVQEGRFAFFQPQVNSTSIVLSTVTSAADLAAQPFSSPNAGTADQTVSFPYGVGNLSATAAASASGDWYDSFYLSTQQKLSASALLIKRVKHAGAVPGAGEYSATVDAPLPGVSAGSYWVIEVADSEGLVPDVNRANNTAVSTSPILVSVPSIAPNATVNGTIASGEQALFRVSLPAGQNVVVTLKSPVAGAAALYESYQHAPSLGNYDEAAFQPTQTQQTLSLDDTQLGVFYLLVQGSNLAGAATTFSLSVQELQFAIASVTPNHGSNAGSATLTVNGSQFTPNTAVNLVASDGTDTKASQVLFKDNTTLFATFALAGLAPGTYSVQVADGGQTFTDAGAFTVSGAAPGQVTFNLSCSAYTHDTNPGTIVINYMNTGGTDVPAPLMILSSDNASFELPGSTTYIPDSVELLGINQNGPAGTLPPDYHGSITLSFLPVNAGPHVVSHFTLSTIPSASTPFDWSTVKSDLQPPTVPNDAWAAIYQNFTAAVGNTLGQYQQVLDKDATYLSQLGVYTVDVSQLLSFELQKADDFGAIDQRYFLGAFGRGWPDPTDVKAVTDSSGDVTIEYSGQVRTFTLESNGTYQGAPGDAATLTLQNGMYTLRETDGSLTVFNSNGTLDYTEDTIGNKITANYTNGLLTSFVDSTGDTVTFTYNSAGRIAQVTDPVGRVTTYTYDPTGQLLLNVADGSGTTSYTYVTGQGAQSQYALGSITYPDSTLEYFTYNSQGQLTSQSADGGAEMLTYSYDGEGGVSVKDADGGTSTYFLNQFEQVAKYEDPLGNFTDYAYDANNNLVQETGPDGVTTTFANNAAGDTTSTTDPLGDTISATYDLLFNNLTSLTDPNGNTTNYSYDTNGNLLDITYPDSTQQQFTYDPTGNLTESVDQNGNAINYKYDPHNLLIEEDFADGTKITFSYDAHRNLKSATNSSGTTSFQYDPADRLTEVTYPNGMYLKFTYNPGGQRTQMVDQTGFTVNYQYDAVGRLSELTDVSGNLIVKYTYDSAGRLTEKDMGNGTSTKYEYNLAGDLTSIVNYEPGGSVLSSYVYAYNAIGLPISVTTLSGTTTYGYDATGQLTSVALPGGTSITYQYDAAGNRVAVTDNGVTTNYATNNMNEYTQVGSTTYTYDKDGNLHSATDSSGTTSYTYNDLNELVGVVSPQGTWGYQYDALGNLIAETHDGQQTQYLIDPTGIGNVVGTFDASGNVIDHFTQGIGLTSQVDASGAAAYYNFDLTGNTTELTGASGAVLNAYSYLPFGEQLNATGSTPNPFTYVGQFGVLTNGSGQDFMRSRMYDPSTGRFTQPDATGLGGGDSNFYRYTDNGPVGAVDPQGTFLLPVAAAGALIGGTVSAGIYTATALIFEPGTISLGGVAGSFVSGAIFGGVVGGTGGLGLLATSAVGASSSAIGYEVQIAIDHEKFNAGKFAEATISGAIPLSRHGTGKFKLPSGAAAEKITFSRTANALNATGKALKDKLVDVKDVAKSLGEKLIHFFIVEDSSQSEHLVNGDPNNLIGPAGFGADVFVTLDQTLPYTIMFANEATADIPVQQVVVTDQLDHNLDWTTFQVGNFSIGGTVYTVPPNDGSYSTQLELTSTLGIYLDVSAGIDLSTGVATWTFTSVDPTTGDLPSDIFTGFLPPDFKPPLGEASVDYTILPKTGVKTGTQIKAQAVVVFDTNAPLSTPQVVNTIDASPPESSVKPLPSSTTSTSFSVSWTGSDGAGSGIASYNVYVSDNGGAFKPFVTGTTKTSATFKGQVGHTYRFFSVATSNVELVQPTPTTAQATTTVHPAPPPAVKKTSLTTSKGSIDAITVYFSEAITTASADNRKNFTLVDAGSSHIFGGKGNTSVTIKSASFNASSHSVKLTLAKPVSTGDSLRLTINAQPPSGIKGTNGQYLNETASGKAGANAVVYLGAPRKKQAKATAIVRTDTAKHEILESAPEGNKRARTAAAALAAIDELLEREEFYR
jgi:RHS repeat-associated protein